MVVRNLVVVLALLFSFAAHSKTITIATGEYPPWTGQNLPHHGYVNHIISEAFASVDIKVNFVYLPWKRAFEEARKGNYDASSYWFDSPERRSVMLYSDAVILNRTVFFQRSEDPPIEWKALADFADYRMSATVGFTYNEAFHRAIANRELQVTMVPTDVQNIKMLMSKRVDIVATDEMSGFYMAATLSVDPRKLRVLEPPMTTAKGYLMASKTSPEAETLIAEFNRGLQQIKANGIYQKILNRVDNNSFYNPSAANNTDPDVLVNH